MKNKKNAWVAAILNFLLPGLGYIYAAKRNQKFAWILLIGGIIGNVGALIKYDLHPLAWLGAFLISVALAYDVFAAVNGE